MFATQLHRCKHMAGRQVSANRFNSLYYSEIRASQESGQPGTPFVLNIWSMSQSYPFRAVKFLITVAFCISLTTSLSYASRTVIGGTVEDGDGARLMGTTILISNGDSILSATQTDENGTFAVVLPETKLEEIVVSASSIGFVTSHQTLSLITDTLEVIFRLAQSIIRIDDLSVFPADEFAENHNVMSSAQVREAASHSIVATNPVSAIRSAGVIRTGSSHSSKLRVHGTNPVYMINSFDIGYDPNHYNMFSVIPAPVISEVIFHASGASAKYSHPAVVEFKTKAPFGEHSASEGNLSFLEATGKTSFGSDNWFAMGSLRKSVLDKLVDQIEVEPRGRTLPPTNFQDIFISGGLKLSPTYRLFVDHYQTRDYLSYSVGSVTGDTPDIHTLQHQRESFVGVRLSALYSKALINVYGAVHSSLELYRATPSDSVDSPRLMMDLNTSMKTWQGGVEAIIPIGAAELVIGDQVKLAPARTIELRQKNWNFLPPDAPSDQPFMFQEELNRMYGEFNKQVETVNHASYLSVSRSFGNLKLELGGRREQFSELTSGTEALVRGNARYLTGAHSSVTLHYGTYAESPLKRILEPYQVMVLDQINDLQPLHTRLVSARFNHERLSVGVFTKHISNIAQVGPDFGLLISDQTPEKGYLQIRSTGEARFYGGDVALTLDNLINKRLRIHSSYGYSRARQRANGITTVHSQDIPHRFRTELAYKVSRKLTAGVDFSVRSGFPFSPKLSNAVALLADRFRDQAGKIENAWPDSPYPGLLDPTRLINALLYQLYRDQLRLKNSERMPMHMSLDIHAGISIGRSTFTLNVANLTNRMNPIINTSSGYISDTGILPSIGYRLRF